jgi:tripartite-type tricarboxylate transporter receptor subunit TctC
MRRRKTPFISMALLALMTFGGATLDTRASAQTFPDKPIRLVVPFTAGGFTDNTARLVGQGLTERLGVSVVIDNRPGSGGNLAGEVAAKSPPDGYTLFMSGAGTNAINPAIYQHMAYNPATDLDPVIALIKTPNMVAVGNEVPAHSLQELVALAKQKPGELNVGTPGNGTTGHFSSALFASVAGIKWTHVPYRGTPQVYADMLSGAIQVTIDNVTTWAPQAASGKVRALAVTSLKRSVLCPDVPTVAEQGYPGFEATSWLGISAPHGTPLSVVNKLNATIQQVLNSKEFQSKTVGADIMGGSPDDYGAFIAQERIKWAKVAKDVGLKVD